MNFVRKIFALLTVTGSFLHGPLVGIACGPSYTEPVFVFKSSPELPFEDFTAGNIGIVRSTYGRKSLAIAYRYLSGGGYSAWEQKALVEALRGTPPEDRDQEDAIKSWVDARKSVAVEEKLPEIYTDRADGGYDFFPNCTRNAFEVATETLKDRAASYGSSDRYVIEWLAGQDRIFDICSSGSEFPNEAETGAPTWFQKDRAYQIAAANFYSLKFDEAKRRFEEIAADAESPWSDTADYLVARTLVRQGSLTKDEKRKDQIYRQAEEQLVQVIARSGKLSRAAEQLLGLVKYRTHPMERMHELASIVAFKTGNDNIRQDLIDYTWLVDKYEAEVLDQIEKEKAEEEKRKAAKANSNSAPVAEPENQSGVSPWEQQRRELESGEVIEITFNYSVPDQTYPRYSTRRFKAGVSDTEVLSAFASEVQRELTTDEKLSILASKQQALDQRKRFLGSNFRFGAGQTNEYPGRGSYVDEQMPYARVPDYLRKDDITDWILNFESRDSAAYEHALKKWREDRSPAWLAAALAKVTPTSPGLDELRREAEKITRSSSAFATVTYHVARVLIEQKKDAEARKLLDGVIVSDMGSLPISAQNQFLELRMSVAATLSEFIRFALRRPASFDMDGTYGKLKDFYEQEKNSWNPEYYTNTKEEWLREVDGRYRDLLAWDENLTFDDRVTDIVNRHFPLDVLARMAVDPEFPDYIRKRLVLTVWTRAVVLGRRDVSHKFAAEVVKADPQMAESFENYFRIKTAEASAIEELWILVKNPKLSVFLKSGIPIAGENEIDSWSDGWWTVPSETEYDEAWNEIPKKVPRPSFITAAESEAAARVRKALTAGGDAETYISNRVFDWTRRHPRDPRLAEALYIVATINLQTKYGEGDATLRESAIKILKARFPNSPWTAKALEAENY
jgi:hypothetical protein